MQQKEDISSRSHSDFSIEHILNYAGGKCSEKNFTSDDDKKIIGQSTTFSWLRCSRFCPPKVPRKFYLYPKCTCMCTLKWFYFA